MNHGDVAELVDLPAGRQAHLASGAMHYVYVLNSKERNYIYVGMTNNLERRVDQHQKGKEVTTAPYRPFELVYTEEYATRVEAREREKYLKSGSGKEWIKRVILKRV